MKYIFSKLSELLSNSKATFSKLGEQISFDNIELPNLSELITADNSTCILDSEGHQKGWERKQPSHP